MNLTCEQRKAVLTKQVDALDRQLWYGQMQLEFTLQKIAAIKAIVCSPPPSGCCQTITEFESAHPAQDFLTPARIALTTARAAVLGIICSDPDWKKQAYDAMERIEEAQAANAAYQAWVDLWIGFLAALSDQGCAIVLKKTNEE